MLAELEMNVLNVLNLECFAEIEWLTLAYEEFSEQDWK